MPFLPIALRPAHIARIGARLDHWHIRGQYRMGMVTTPKPITQAQIREAIAHRRSRG